MKGRWHIYEWPEASKEERGVRADHWPSYSDINTLLGAKRVFCAATGWKGSDIVATTTEEGFEETHHAEFYHPRIDQIIGGIYLEE